jgi:hypothetical protein
VSVPKFQGCTGKHILIDAVSFPETRNHKGAPQMHKETGGPQHCFIGQKLLLGLLNSEQPRHKLLHLPHVQIIKKRQFSDNAIKEFIHLLQKESWDQVLMLEYVNKSFNAFMITFMCHFNALFPTKTFYLNKNKKNKWMTKGLIVSRNKLRILNSLKRSTQISVEF